MLPENRDEGQARDEEPVSLHDRVERLFRESRDDVYYYAAGFGLAAHEAQDIAQDVFLQFYMALKRGETIENARGWIFRAAHNLAVNAARREKTRRLFATAQSASGAVSRDDAERRLIREQALEKLRQALGQLSPQQRLCLQLRSEGLRYAEIAQTIGVGTSTVGEFLSRALRRLRKAVGE